MILEAREISVRYGRAAPALDRVSCAVYRTSEGFQLRIESPAGTILTEPFEMQPRMLARSKALHTSLKRRGWHDPPA